MKTKKIVFEYPTITDSLVETDEKNFKYLYNFTSMYR